MEGGGGKFFQNLSGPRWMMGQRLGFGMICGVRTNY
jgi:hypothetical protein